MVEYELPQPDGSRPTSLLAGPGDTEEIIAALERRKLAVDATVESTLRRAICNDFRPEQPGTENLEADLVESADVDRVRAELRRSLSEDLDAQIAQMRTPSQLT